MIMATTKFYLDTRATTKGQPAPLKLTITLKGKSAHLNLNIKLLPSQWDAKANKILNHPNKNFLNQFIVRRKLDVDTAIMTLQAEGKLGNDATKLKNTLQRMFSGEATDMRTPFVQHLLKFANSKKESTRGVYIQTLNRLRAFNSNVDELMFEDITKDWLVEFESFLALTNTKNARNIHLRNIRAVFNDAINEELTTAYPFRRFKIRPVPTAKRALTVEQLRTLANYPVEEYAEKHRDMFMLIFYLIGINIVDLFNLECITNEGRIEYHRAKTGRMYSIKIVPEALHLINKYKGQKKLLYMADNYGKHQDYAKYLNKALQRIGELHIGKQGKKTIKPIFPQITTYWARHTWATIASELDIPKETIAAALGHGGNTVTDIYIDFDRKKVDEANRRVIDWVLYGKR